MAPYIFYRVEDAESRAQCSDEEEGIFAEDRDTWVNFNNYNQRLQDQVERHLDWGNRVPTQFISMYSDEDVAHREAERRVEDGKKNVTVCKINMRRCNERNERREYRNVRLLADNLGLYIPERAWHNSEYEYIVLHDIPGSAIVGWIEL